MDAGGDNAKRLWIGSWFRITRFLNSFVTRRSESSLNASVATSSENIGKQVMCNCLSSIRKSIAAKVSFSHMWNDVLVIWCVIANLLDPLFCYILVVDQMKNCIGFDEKLRMKVVVLRSLIDVGYILLVVWKFRIGDTASSDKNNGGFCSIARRYLLSSFAVDILAVLPLPQVMVLLVFRATKASHFTIAIRTLKFVLVFQLLPRVFRVYSFSKKVRWSSGIFPISSRSKAISNLFLVILASHVFGAVWYLFSVERKATCLQVRCHSHPYCYQNYNNSSTERLCMDACSGKASSSDIAAFNFGIFDDAFNSGIVYSTDFIWKISYCSWWGLQNLSSLGQGLKTSGYLWEIYFAASVTISGLVSFALLIGNLQTILQAKAARQEEMRLKGDDIKQWMHYQKLPPSLKKQIKQHEKNKWMKTRGIDIKEIFLNLPRDIKRQTAKHLCEEAIKSVPMFQYADDTFLNVVCGYLMPRHITHSTSIICKGKPLEEVIFITSGKLCMYSNSMWVGGKILEEGHYFGKDLLNQVFKHPKSSTIPISTKTITALTEVEIFVLSAKDLKSTVSCYWWRLNQGLRNDPTYKERRKDPNYEEPWAPWAVNVLQTRWRRIMELKCRIVVHSSMEHNVPVANNNNSAAKNNNSVAKNIHGFGRLIHRAANDFFEKLNKKGRKRSHTH